MGEDDPVWPTDNTSADGNRVQLELQKAGKTLNEEWNNITARMKGIRCFVNNNVKAANNVLATDGSDSEENVRVRICNLLTRMGYDEYHLEYSVGRRAADIFLPRHRIIIETKALHKADQPHKKPARDQDSPFEQLNHYLQTEIAKERASLFRDESDRRWTGLLTDGQVWHRWSYEHRDNPVAQEEEQNFRPANGNELVEWLTKILAGDPIGKPWIPNDPVPLFEIHCEELRAIYDGLQGTVANETETKQNLWGDLLRSSGMYPATPPARIRLFVSHSFLVALARGVIWSMAGEEGKPDAQQLLGDGFIAWIVQTMDGRNWAECLLARINEYDWRMRQGDVLRPLYEAFVSKEDRQDFGEVYTPDWLAELVVRETLDEEWCQKAIEAALAEIHNQKPLRGVGVLDPACGSGTFLYHAIRRLLEHESMATLTEGMRTQVAGRLVNGIDIHPVAYEFSRATILRALPSTPTGGPDDLRIYNGDALQLQDNTDGTVFNTANGGFQITSPGGSGTITLPRSFVERDDLAGLVRQLVESVQQGVPLPAHIRSCVEDDQSQAVLLEAYRLLGNIINREGNSVWGWFITNSAGPYLLSRHRVNRIVSNPPWVRISHINFSQRRKIIQEAADRADLWPEEHRNSSNFDIAQLFVKNCRESYLNNIADRAGWITKSSAIKAQHWEKLRAWRNKNIATGQIIDLVDVQVFGGGDARRCCLLFDMFRSSLGDGDQLVGNCPDGRPSMNSTREEAMNRIAWVVPDTITAAPSYYIRDGFRRGWVVYPKVLTKIEDLQEGQDAGTVLIKTKRSPRPPWAMVPEQELEIPESWAFPIIDTKDMLTFSMRPGDRQRAIIPLNQRGELLTHDEAMLNDGWTGLNNIYTEINGGDHHQPKPLMVLYRTMGALKAQLPLEPATGREQVVVLYPASGDIMRGCRFQPGQAVIASGLYYLTCDTPDEAAYLVALLNAPSLLEAFKSSRTSGRHFHLNPWRNIPIPVFDPTNNLHQELAALTPEAEEVAKVYLGELEPSQTLPVQWNLSRQIRTRLADAGIAGRIDAAVAQLLPDQVR